MKSQYLAVSLLTAVLLGGIVALLPAADMRINVRRDVGNGRFEFEDVLIKGEPANLIPRYFYGAAIEYTNVSTVSIGTAGATSSVRSDDNDYSITFTGQVTADLSVSGAGGLDTGTEAASTWYAVYVIADTTETNSVAGLLSISSTSPTLPAGYDEFRRAGWAYNDSGSSFRPFLQQIEGPIRRYWWDADASSLEALTDGTASTYTSIDFSSYIPPTSKSAPCLFWFSTGSTGNATDEFRVRPVGFTADPPPWRMRMETVSANEATVFFELPLSSSQAAEYKVTDATKNKASVTVMGFNDQL